jgi:hypothetical protein
MEKTLSNEGKIERAQIREVVGVYDNLLKHVFGEYKIVGIDVSKNPVQELRVVWLASTRRHYKSKSQDLSGSYATADSDSNTIFMNLTKEQGHWFKTKYADYYSPTELSMSFFHEFFHIFGVLNDSKKSEEEQIVAIENVLRGENDFMLILMKNSMPSHRQK